jgi:hypothetical protein
MAELKVDDFDIKMNNDVIAELTKKLPDRVKIINNGDGFTLKAKK